MRKDEKCNQALKDEGEVNCDDPEKHWICGRRSRKVMNKCIFWFVGMYFVVITALILFRCNPTAIRTELNSQSGFISADMKR